MRRYYGNSEDFLLSDDNSIDSSDIVSDYIEDSYDIEYVKPRKKSKGLLLTFFIVLFIYFAFELLSVVFGINYIIQSSSNRVDNPPKRTVEVTADIDDIETYSPDDFSSDIDYYVRNQLSDSEKYVYDTLYSGLINMQPSIMINSTVDEIGIMFDYIMAEHPEIFYLNGYVYYDYSDRIEVMPNYTMTRNKRNSYQELIDEQCNEWLSQVELNTDDYSKVKKLYEILITNVDYELDCPENQNIISVFVNKNTVCNGYASAMVYMCQKLGIECTKLIGYGNDELHAWNLIKEDGKYYLVDVTWGNTLYNSNIDAKYVNYAYLNCTNKFLDKSHTCIDKFDIPMCTDIDNNYFYRENLLFDSVDESKDAFYYLTYDPIISVRYTDEDTYNDAIDRLLSDGEIYKCFDWSGDVDIRYFDDDDNYVLSVVRCDF